MKHRLLILFAGMIGCFGAKAQGNLINTPETLSLEVVTASQPVVFTNAADYSGSKTIPAYYRLHVKAPPVPWVITATVKDLYTSSSQEFMNEKMVSLVSLRSQDGDHSIRLSSTPQVILQSTNTLPENDYVIDLIADPPFNVPPGDYLFIVNFQLALQ